jgi:hypothetical protein
MHVFCTVEELVLLMHVLPVCTEHCTFSLLATFSICMYLYCISTRTIHVHLRLRVMYVIICTVPMDVLAVGCFRKCHFGIPRNTEFYTELVLFRVILRNFLLFNSTEFRIGLCIRNSV